MPKFINFLTKEWRWSSLIARIAAEIFVGNLNFYQLLCHSSQQHHCSTRLLSPLLLSPVLPDALPLLKFKTGFVLIIIFTFKKTLVLPQFATKRLIRNCFSQQWWKRVWKGSQNFHQNPSSFQMKAISKIHEIFISSMVQTMIRN